MGGIPYCRDHGIDQIKVFNFSWRYKQPFKATQKWNESFETTHPSFQAKPILCMRYDSYFVQYRIFFSEKRLGYWAASQCFDEGTDVLMLTTNLIKKDILKGSEWESGLALGGLACFMTPDLGLFSLLISAKTVVIMYF